MRKSWWVLLGIALFMGGMLAAHSEADAKKRPAVKMQIQKPAKAAAKPAAAKAAQKAHNGEVCRRDPSVPEGQIDIFERICTARGMLEKERAEMKVCPVKHKKCTGKGKKQKCRLVVVGHRVCGRSVILAAMDKTSGAITLVTATKGKNGKSSPPGYTVRKLTNNSLNSEYAVAAPPGRVVIGIQYPMMIATKQGLKAVRAHYAPYSRELEEAFPTLTTMGELYLRTVIIRAYQTALDAKVDVANISSDVLYALIMIEHFSSEVVGDAAVAGEMQRIQTTVGANGTEAYRYAVSSQKARGLCQIIPSTYQSLRRRYPALLLSDFLGGTANHANAVTAQLLLAKEDLSYLFSKPGWRGNEAVRQSFLADSRRVGEYLAVAYNGGGPRAHRWEAGKRKGSLPDETAKYLVKFQQVWDVLYPPEPTPQGAAALAKE